MNSNTHKVEFNAKMNNASGRFAVKDESEEEEVRTCCEKCEGEGYVRVSKERAKELKEQELLEGLCPFGDKCAAEEEESNIVFNCSGCDVGIIRDSRDHDNCVTKDGKKWYCLDCYHLYEEEEEGISKDELETMKKTIDELKEKAKKWDLVCEYWNDRKNREGDFLDYMCDELGFNFTWSPDDEI